ncbi:MAG: hypothetical protein L6R39_000682 [Caloplaca ligustica]|nr:MAG: hypothetical protein L6R39_000682 [Caloplaca ligustica]
MDTVDLVTLLEALDDDIDGLEEALGPVTKGALTDTASRLPLLDKAQLYVLITYAIETILARFSYLRLNGINAKEHEVFKELTRVKQYFEKIKNAENAGSSRQNLSLDKAAAGRIIKHALDGNKQYGLKRKEQQEASGQILESKSLIADLILGGTSANHSHVSGNVQVQEDHGEIRRKKRRISDKKGFGPASGSPRNAASRPESMGA